MRKRFITSRQETAQPHGEGWLNLERAAVVEVTSEEEGFPVECALLSGETQGWRADMPGSQTIRLVFDQPQTLGRISLVFEERETTRTQEFVLRWSADGGRSFREIVRQQWNFSPPQTITSSSKVTSDSLTSYSSTSRIVGIFYLFRGKLLIDSTPLAQAAPHGDHFIYGRDHIEYWAQLVSTGTVPDDEYEEHPRGRVSYNEKTRKYTLLADRCIFR